MDLDSRAQYKLVSVGYSDVNFEEYRRILEALCPLGERYDHETPEMWCSRIRDPFRKILEENPRILSKNGYITMYGNLYEHDKVHGLPSNYIYCSMYSRNTISNEHARRNEILKSIDRREFQIWQYKQYILQEEAKINRLCLELFSHSASHSEKDKLASVSYDHDANFIARYENYAQSKATVTKNTMPSAPDLNPFRVSPARQEMIPPTSYQSSNCKSDTGEIFISSRYAKQNNLLPSINNLNQPALRLEDRIKITFV
ncbi:4704_t:CDS:2 [Ambispora gerdemannii]|uniref:4704_t:CDS:1 n=1 Tax=Ambispora gerdemannii TaxID=144530 RepID=A0A9N9A6R3_9GLOM|nr:4704_t:CDS:2 [Ambispora gerdemannii]